MRAVLQLKDKLNNYGKELYEKKSLLIMGRGYQYGTCMEGAFVSSFWMLGLKLLLLEFAEIFP